MFNNFPQKNDDYFANFHAIGQSYDNDQELRTHPSAIIDNELDEESGYFEKLGAKTEHFLEQFFTVWGTWCANNPWNVLLLGM